ncbi:MAG TPA: DUF3995 domain-containing protein [Mesorhizobium sp.]
MQLALATGGTLLAIAALHAYWGVGGVWPGTDERSCARTVGGFPGAVRMPGPASCFAVTAALFVAAIIALALGGILTLPFPALLLSLGGFGAALVFVGRGFAGFTLIWRRHTPEQPFAKLDVRYYSPLCLAIGAAFLILILQGANG